MGRRAASKHEATDPHLSCDKRAERIALYSLEKVRSALGVRTTYGSEPRDTEHQSRLADIIDRGETGRWRLLLPPPTEALTEIAALVTRAPHFEELSSLVTMHLRSANVIGLWTQLPPILLVGSHGLGKSWFLSRLGALLGLPYKRYPMSSSSLGEGISGSHPSWRNAAPGLVGRTLLTEVAANPILFVDEFDKAGRHLQNEDPYRPFYALLDPSDAGEFVDEFLGFPIDASNVVWIMAANDTAQIPEPICDRLKIIKVPEPDEAQKARIAVSIYNEANAARRCFFDPELEGKVSKRLVNMSPRVMRKVVNDAMVSASAEGRRRLRPDDIVAPRDHRRMQIGFCS